ncbi:MAG: hypothetical protein H0U57_09750 [Tatlockia sp.]|nr:hypothetical protein [Tatlockia sp.]
MMIKRHKKLKLLVTKIITTTLVGVISIPLFAATKAEVDFDGWGRLISYPGKKEVACPTQDNKTGVLLVIGQSNSANHADKAMITKYPEKVYNYFNGKCYVASSPLLGATGTHGEFLTPLADYLLEMNVYKNIIIISSGMDGTKVARWEKGGDLNNMLMSVLDELKSKFKITEVIFHQGESDYLERTPPLQYQQSFKSLVSSLRLEGKNTPPFYYSIATRCGYGWYAHNPIALVQHTLASYEDKIYLGADTDVSIPASERSFAICHFTEIGQLKAAYAFALAIAQNKEPNL